MISSVKAAPTTMATARSMTLPRMMKSRKPAHCSDMHPAAALAPALALAPAALAAAALREGGSRPAARQAAAAPPEEEEAGRVEVGREDMV